MAISDLPIFSMLRTRMQWHQERQRVLAENVSNADTPRFRPRDLDAARFRPRRCSRRAASFTLAQHRPGAHHGAGGERRASRPSGRTNTTCRPAGNAVNLEDEMMKVAANQMDYQAAISLYSRSIGLFKTAIGKR